MTRRDQVATKYKKKIELMVRKPDKDAEELEEVGVETGWTRWSYVQALSRAPRFKAVQAPALATAAAAL